MVQMPYLQHTLKYYYPVPHHRIEGVYTNADKSETVVHAEMVFLTAEIPELWLVVSEEDVWDRRHMVRAWLDQNAELVDKANFMRVDLYHYRLSPRILDTSSLP